MTRQYEFTVRCFLYVLNVSATGSSLAAKVLFALKQLTAHSIGLKQETGSATIMKVLGDLSDEKVKMTVEFTNEALLFLMMLSTTVENAEKMADNDIWGKLEVLKNQKVCKSGPAA